LVFLLLELVRLQESQKTGFVSNWFSPFSREKEKGRLTGAIYLLAGCLIASLLFPRSIAVAAIILVSVGDPAATLVGTCAGKTRFWGKSLEGHAACLAVCLISGVFLSSFLQFPAMSVFAAGAIFATLFQALPLRLNDNVTIPVGSALIMLTLSTWLVSL
jgi:acyl phosphate:glycerol-3-phosphate acyltransferase